MKTKTVTIKAPGKKPIKFRRGGLHKSLGVPMGEKIPAKKMSAAKAGKYGALAKKQASMATELLAAGRKTMARKKRRGK